MIDHDYSELINKINEEAKIIDENTRRGRTTGYFYLPYTPTFDTSFRRDYLGRLEMAIFMAGETPKIRKRMTPRGKAYRKLYAQEKPSLFKC